MTIRLMLADDHRMLREGLGRSMREQGFDVVGEAGDGAEAVSMAQRLRPDVILMDVTMPEMDGVETIRQMMTLQPPPNILVVSALNDKSTAIMALRLGARGFINKPFTDQELRAALLDVADTSA